MEISVKTMTNVVLQTYLNRGFRWCRYHSTTMGRLVIITGLLTIAALILPSEQGGCAGYASLTFKGGNDPYCDNPRDRTGWTWFFKLNCNCCPGFVRDGIPGRTSGSCVPICWSKCAERDPNTSCTPEQIRRHEHFRDPRGESKDCPANHD